MKSRDELLAMLMAIAPPGVEVVFARAESGYARSMRRLFRVPDGPDDVVLARKDGVFWAAVPSALVVRFTPKDDGEIVVEPYLLVVDPAQMTWSAPLGFAQPAIDLTQDLMLRIAKTGVVQ